MAIRVGFVGAGPRGRGQAEAYRPLRNRAELVAIADLDPERRNAFAEEFAVPRRYSSYEALLEAETLDVLHVAAPVTLRQGPIALAAERKVSVVVVEKPFAVNRRDYDAMLTVAEAAGTRIVINHQLRYQTNWIRIHEAVVSGRIGALERILVSCKGNLLEQGTHLLDLVVLMADDRGPGTAVAAVYGTRGFQTTHPAPDNAVGVLQFDDGLVVDFYIGSHAPTLFDEQSYWLTFGMRLLGASGRAETSLEGGYRIWGRGETDWSGEQIDYGRQNDAAQIDFTADVLRLVEDPEFQHPCDARTGRLSYEWIEAIALAGALQRPVRFPLPPEVSGLAILSERARAEHALNAAQKAPEEGDSA